MNHCAIAIATLISIRLSHAKLAGSHVAIQQLALRSSRSLQSEASRASDMNVQNISNEIMNPEILGYKANDRPLVQLRTNHYYYYYYY